jgi:hypothetical protein
VEDDYMKLGKPDPDTSINTLQGAAKATGKRGLAGKEGSLSNLQSNQTLALYTI